MDIQARGLYQLQHTPIISFRAGWFRLGMNPPSHKVSFFILQKGLNHSSNVLRASKLAGYLVRITFGWASWRRRSLYWQRWFYQCRDRFLFLSKQNETPRGNNNSFLKMIVLLLLILEGELPLSGQNQLLLPGHQFLRWLRRDQELQALESWCGLLDFEPTTGLDFHW